MKKLLEENITILTHVVGFAGPASCLPMEYALRIPIPEFGYSFLEKRFYPPITDGKSLLTYDNTFIRYPVKCGSIYVMYLQGESREYDSGRTLRQVNCSVRGALETDADTPGYVSVSMKAPNFVMYDPISERMPQFGGETPSRVIDSYTIREDIPASSTHFIYAVVVPVRDILSLFRKKMKELPGQDDEEDNVDEYCEGGSFWRCLYEDCGSCPGCRKEKDDEVKKDEAGERYLKYKETIISFQMRRAIVENMYPPPSPSPYYRSSNKPSARDLDRTFRLRHWYWQISRCDDELLNQEYGSHSRIGYIDNEGILTLDELLWKLKKYDSLRDFFNFRRMFRESKKSEDTLVAEFFESDDLDTDDDMESWWMLYSGVYTAKDVKVHGAHCIYNALGYDRYQEAAAMFHALDFRYEGEGEYEDLKERLGIFEYG